MIEYNKIMELKRKYRADKFEVVGDVLKLYRLGVLVKELLLNNVTKDLNKRGY